MLPCGRQLQADRFQTGVTDLPLTANGERMVTDMGNRIIGPGSEFDGGDRGSQQHISTSGAYHSP